MLFSPHGLNAHQADISQLEICDTQNIVPMLFDRLGHSRQSYCRIVYPHLKPMAYEPEKWQVLDHVLKYSNKGTDADDANPLGTRELSPRSKEHTRIEAYERFVTPDLVTTALKDKSTYINIKDSLTIALVESGVLDDENVLLHLIAVALEEKRTNVESAMEREGRQRHGGRYTFSNFKPIFTSRLWPEDNPPWLYPEASILWAKDMTERKLWTHRNRAATQFATLRSELLDLPVDEQDDIVRASAWEKHSDTPEGITLEAWQQHLVSEWKQQRNHLRRDAEILEAFIVACDGVIRWRERSEDMGSMRDSDQELLKMYGSWDDKRERWQRQRRKQNGCSE